MKTIEIKRDFHNFIDSIENVTFLENFYELMKNRFSQKNGLLWSRLSTLEKDEMLKSFNESENPKNLIDNNAMKTKLKKWL